jgi:hypothetical protein
MTHGVMYFLRRNDQQAQTARPTQFPRGAGGKHSRKTPLCPAEEAKGKVTMSLNGVAALSAWRSCQLGMCSLVTVGGADPAGRIRITGPLQSEASRFVASGESQFESLSGCGMFFPWLGCRTDRSKAREELKEPTVPGSEIFAG